MIKNYEYGLLDPTANAQLVDDQMRAAHRYYNQLVEIERERRAEIAAILVGHPDTEALAARVADLARQREEARLAIKATRQATRDRSETSQMRDRVKDLATELRAARATLKTARDVIKTDAVIVAAISACDDRATTRVKARRAACEAYWGSYKLSEEAVDAAKKAKAPPHFKRWTGDGRVSVQLQGGISDGELFGTDTQVQVAPVSPDAHDLRKPRGVRRLASRTILRLRVQSTEKGRPIWAEWPMILHRPIPEGARVKIATVSRRRRDCRRWDWRVLLTLEIPDGASEHRRLIPASGAIALNLGWCKRPEDAVRAGYVLSDDGVIDREVIVPPSTINRVEKSEAIRSQRDKDLDAMRVTLVAWLRAHEAGLPAWVVERTILSREPRAVPQVDTPRAEAVRDASQRTRAWHVAQWRSAARFRALAFAWRSQRFDGDGEGYQVLEDWRYRDEHLERYESGMRRGGLLDRRERYRMLAADLAARYRTLVVDDFDLRTFAEIPKPEDESANVKPHRKQQRYAAGSELRAALLNAFGPTRVLRESSVDVTRACAAIVVDEATGAEHTCGQLDLWDHTVAREHTCSGCGATWDQDQNACKNLIGRWRERLGADGSVETARVATPRKESRSERLRRTRWKREPEAEAASTTEPHPSPSRVAPVAPATAAPTCQKSPIVTDGAATITATAPPPSPLRAPSPVVPGQSAVRANRPIAAPG